MPRPKKQRNICAYPDYWSFAPDFDKSNDTIILSLDELESIRLIDYLHKTQEQCAAQMNISRTSVTAIYNTARSKIASALIEGKRIIISGGDYTIKNTVSSDIKTKGSNTMRIAVTYEKGMIFQHFGKTEQFKLYDIENEKIINSQIVDTNGQGSVGGISKKYQYRCTDMRRYRRWRTNGNAGSGYHAIRREYRQC